MVIGSLQAATVNKINMAVDSFFMLIVHKRNGPGILRQGFHTLYRWPGSLKNLLEEASTNFFNVWKKGLTEGQRPKIELRGCKPRRAFKYVLIA
jgi:hypothetical protein